MTSNDYFRTNVGSMQRLWGPGRFSKNSNFHKILIFLFFAKFNIFVWNIIVLVFVKKMMNYTLTLVTIFNVISQFFENPFFQRYYISTSYTQLRYNTGMKLNIIRLSTKGSFLSRFSY